LDAVDIINWLNKQKEYANHAYNSINEDIRKDEKRKAKGKESSATPSEYLRCRQSIEKDLEVIEFLIGFLRERIELKK